jgi:hypothetical protein
MVKILIDYQFYMHSETRLIVHCRTKIRRRRNMNLPRLLPEQGANARRGGEQKLPQNFPQVNNNNDMQYYSFVQSPTPSSYHLHSSMAHYNILQ